MKYLMHQIVECYCFLGGIKIVFCLFHTMDSVSGGWGQISIIPEKR